MDLLRAGEIVVSGCNNRAVGLFQPAQLRLKPLHGHAAQVDDVLTEGLIMGRQQRPHHIRGVKNDSWILGDDIT